MLRLTVSTEEYLMIGDNIKVVFLGGTKNHLRIMVDAPKEVTLYEAPHWRNRSPIRKKKQVFLNTMQNPKRIPGI